MPGHTLAASSSVPWIAVVGAAVITAAASIAAAVIARRRPAERHSDPAPTNTAVIERPKPQLPPRVTFINRHTEMERAVSKIRAGGSLLTIEGEIGVGKSAVASELLHRLHANAEHFSLVEHAFLWIDARDGCPSLVDMCRYLNLTTDHQSLSAIADTEKLDALRRHLANRKTVLLIDNLSLEDDPESAALRELLRTVPSGSLVIASVNRAATLQAPRVPLQDLSLRHVGQLIRQQVDDLGLEERGRFDDAFVKRVHAAVGGNPFMIAWFLRALVGNPESLEERLVALEHGEGPQELFERVWRDLSETSRAVLTACAYLGGHAMVDQLVVATVLPSRRVLSELKALLGRGLVATTNGDGRTNAHSCARGLQRFVLAQASDTTHAELTKRLSAHYAEHFEGSWEDAGWAISHLDAIRTVLEQLFKLGDDQELQRLFRATFDIFMTLGLFDDRITYGRLAYQSADRAGNHRDASLACSVVSSTHAIRGEWAPAKEALALGLIAAENSGLRGEKARQMREAGFLKYRSGDPRGALEAVEGAAELADNAGDLNNLVDILGLQMSAHLYLQELDQAEVAARRYLALCDRIPWERAKSNPLRHLAEIAIHRCEDQEARELLDRARAIAAEYNDARGLARLSMTEARLFLLSRQAGAARRAASRAASAAAELSLPAEALEARALHRASWLALLIPPLRMRYRRRRPVRLSDAPVGGD